MMKIRCPKCQQYDQVQQVGNTHYICNHIERMDHTENGRPQFTIIQDDEIHFPYNQIFVKRKVDEFFRSPYLKLKDIGVTET